MKRIALSVALLLALVSAPAPAQKGKGGKTSEPDHLLARATFLGSGGIEGSGSLESASGQQKVWFYTKSGGFVMEIDPPLQGVLLQVRLDKAVGDPVGWCSRNRSDVSSPVTTDHFGVATWQKVVLNYDEDGNVTGYTVPDLYDFHFDVLHMDPGSTVYVRMTVGFSSQALADTSFNLTYNRSNNQDHGNMGIVQVTRNSVDTWTFTTLPVAVPAATLPDEANLRWYVQAPATKGNKTVTTMCDMGQWIVPFTMVVTTNLQ